MRTKGGVSRADLGSLISSAKGRKGVSCSKDIQSNENEKICEKIEYNDENLALDYSRWISRSNKILPRESQTKSFYFRFAIDIKQYR
jgi:hypothetical protein